MAVTGLATPRLDWHAADLPQALKKFKAVCELYFSGPLKSKSEQEKIKKKRFRERFRNFIMNPGRASSIFNKKRLAIFSSGQETKELN
jgi:hypothetical protein